MIKYGSYLHLSILYLIQSSFCKSHVPFDGKNQGDAIFFQVLLDSTGTNFGGINNKNDKDNQVISTFT